jgi:hypothetical protein
MFTQPLMYQAIKRHKNSLALYIERLTREGVVPKDQVCVCASDAFVFFVFCFYYSSCGGSNKQLMREGVVPRDQVCASPVNLVVCHLPTNLAGWF